MTFSFLSRLFSFLLSIYNSKHQQQQSKQWWKDTGDVCNRDDKNKESKASALGVENIGQSFSALDLFSLSLSFIFCYSHLLLVSHLLQTRVLLILLSSLTQATSCFCSITKPYSAVLLTIYCLSVCSLSISSFSRFISSLSTFTWLAGGSSTLLLLTLLVRTRSVGKNTITGGVFVVLLCGLAMAIVVAILEFCWNSKRNAQQEKVRKMPK